MEVPSERGEERNCAEEGTTGGSAVPDSLGAPPSVDAAVSEPSVLVLDSTLFHSEEMCLGGERGAESNQIFVVRAIRIQ